MTEERSKGRLQEIDDIQSDEYAFPYHYIPAVGSVPMLRKSWGFAESYIAAINLVQLWLSEHVLGPQSASHRHMDYGCGDGGFIYSLNQEKLFKHVEFEGIDIDRRAIDWAELFSLEKQNVTFHCGDLLELSENAYDSGTLIEVLEHIPPDAVPRFVEGLSRSLKQGAQLFVTVPSVEKPVSQKHYRHFDFRTLQDCFVEHFEVLDCFGFEKRSWIGRWFKRNFMRRKRYLETAFTTRYLIRELEEKHKDLKGCGRIGLVLRKPHTS